MSLKAQVQELVAQGDVERLNALVAEESRAIRYLVGCSYREEEETRQIACQALGRASRHHPDLIHSTGRIVRIPAVRLSMESDLAERARKNLSRLVG